jgi:hypothetical protein
LRLLRSSDENIPNDAAHPSTAAIVQRHDEHLIVRLTLASGGTALSVEIVEVLTRQISVVGQSLDEFGLNNG